MSSDSLEYYYVKNSTLHEVYAQKQELTFAGVLSWSLVMLVVCKFRAFIGPWR